MSISIVKNRFYYIIKERSGNSGSASTSPTTDLNNIQPDGSWTDINYETRPDTPAARIRGIVRAYLDSNNSLHQNPTVKDKLISAINYWIAQPKANASNWWYRWGEAPLSLVSALFLMYTQDSWGFDDIQLAALADSLTYTSEMPPSYQKLSDGVNTEVFIMVSIAKGLLKNSTVDVEREVNRFKSIQVFQQILAHGVKSDYSYHHHLCIPYWHDYYGNGHLTWASRVLYACHTSEYEFDTALVDNIVESIIFGYGMTQHNGIPDPTQRHRTTSQNQFTPVVLSSDLQNIIDCGYRVSELNAVVASFTGAQYPFQGTHSHYTSNIIFQKGNNFHISVNCPTRRNLRVTETFGLSISKPVRHMGSTHIMVHGEEIKDIFSLARFSRLSGVTFHDLTNAEMETLSASMGDNYYITNPFGGVCASTEIGIAVYNHDRFTLSAKKFYMTTPIGIFCLGAGINSDTVTYSQAVVTGVLQKKIAGTATIKRASESTVTTEVNHTDIEWAWQADMGVVFPVSQNVHISNVTVNGNVQNDRPDESSSSRSGNVFSAWINHGNPVSNGTYQYAVIPNISLSDFRNFANPFTIIQNDSSIQAVKYGNDTYGICFHEAGIVTLESGISVSVIGPGLYILEFNSARTTLKMSVSDPIGIPNMKCEISMQLTGSEKIKHSNVKSTMLEFKAPAGEFIGKATVFNLQKVEVQ